MLFLGDQVYADETTEEMQEFIKARRDIEEAPGKELKDYEEYAHLYRLAWSDPLNRWLLSTLPSSMIFDDHDVRDDWNTSYAWKQEIEKTDWWHGRIVSGLGVVLDLPAPRQPLARRSATTTRCGSGSIAPPGRRRSSTSPSGSTPRPSGSHQHPETFRWSYARELRRRAAGRRGLPGGPGARAGPARPARPGRGAAWLDEQLRGDVKHLLIGTSLPFLLPPGLHYLEAWNEAVGNGAWGRRSAALGEKLRQAVDLEHWAAFQEAFQDVAQMVVEVADGKRGKAPQTVTFLSGDVHHSYLAEVERPHWAGSSRIMQAVCSPIRNPLPRKMRFVTAALAYAIAGPMGKLVAHSAKVANAPFSWHNIAETYVTERVGCGKKLNSNVILMIMRFVIGM